MSELNEKQLLPVGSVVLLNNGEKHLMIYGLLQVKADDKQLFDYIGCLYPEGFMSKDHTYMFNHSDIKDVAFLGFINAEQQVFNAKINELIKSGKMEKVLEQQP